MIDHKLVPVAVNVINKGGGGGAVGIGYVSASRKADPNTIILVNGSTQITPLMNPQAKTLTEVEPVMNVMLDDFVIFVKGDAPWKTAADFAKDAKSKPPKTYNFASGGTTDAMGVKVLSKAIGAELNNVQFNSGGEALTALLGGHVHASIGNPIEFMGHLKSGGVRGIGVFRQTRFEGLPDVPTLKELGITAPDFQMWRGIAMPKGVPDAAVKYWEGVMKKVTDSPEFKKYLADNVASQAPFAGKDFADFLAKQEALYRDLIAK
jgi:putative tricarboxylic transport membrane protein